MDIAQATKERIEELCEKKKMNFCRLATIKKICDGLEISVTDFFDTETFKNLEQEIK